MEPLQKILGAAIELFSQYGFKTITMDDIARRAGISKKTLYQHFANKNEIVSETIVWHKTEICERCKQVMEGAENAVDAMVKTIEEIDVMYLRINPIALLELQRFFPEAHKVFQEQLLAQDVASVRENIEQGMREGLYRAGVDADLMARFHIETALMMLQPNLLMSDRQNIQYVHRQLTEHFLYGIMTPQGETLYTQYKDQYLKQAPKI